MNFLKKSVNTVFSFETLKLVAKFFLWIFATVVFIKFSSVLQLEGAKETLLESTKAQLELQQVQNQQLQALISPIYNALTASVQLQQQMSQTMVEISSLLKILCKSSLYPELENSIGVIEKLASQGKNSLEIHRVLEDHEKQKVLESLKTLKVPTHPITESEMEPQNIAETQDTQASYETTSSFTHKVTKQPTQGIFLKKLVKSFVSWMKP